MKIFQLQGLGNHPSVVVTYVSFLVANSEIGQSDKLREELKEFKEIINTISLDIKATKVSASAATTKADKTLKVAKKRKDLPLAGTQGNWEKIIFQSLNNGVEIKIGIKTKPKSPQALCSSCI
eukprot:10033377-Ditylum_brightwellii.AAC.2